MGDFGVVAGAAAWLAGAAMVMAGVLGALFVAKLAGEVVDLAEDRWSRLKEWIR